MATPEVSPQTNGQGKSETLQPNLDAALNFLKLLYPDGPWVPTAIVPDGATTTRTFIDLEAVRTFITAHNESKNLYYTLNRLKGPMNIKPKKEDITEVVFVHADLDPNDNETPEQAKARYLEQLKTFTPKPTVIVDSGNGIQALWRLKKPLGPEYFARGEAISKAVTLALGGKAGTQNIDRILRLPGTINHPNKTKRATGRLPCMSRLIEFNEFSYTLDEFPQPDDDGAQHARQDADNDESDNNLEWLIRTGGNVPEGERSEKVWRAVNEMLRQNYARSAIISTLLDPANGISAHVRQQHNPRAYAQRQITEAAKHLDDWPRIRSIEIRPGTVETFKVSIGGGTVVVDAEALNHFPWFNRACIAQLRRSFTAMRQRAWSSEVDRALRVAREPVQLTEEQVRWHGTETWRNGSMTWLVRERIPERGVGLLSGQFSTFKSFVLLDLAGSVMTGWPFLKARTIRRGSVLIFAAEGANDLPMRLAALIDHRLANQTDDPDLFKRSKIDLNQLPFAYVAHCRPLLDPKTVDWMVAKAREAQDYFQNQFGLDLVLIGIDTMSAAAGWDNENDAAQSQVVMNHLADVSKATGAFVLAADHFGKDISAGTRGSVVKEASADTILATLGERDEETNTMGDTRLVIRKQRSGPQGDVFPFEARLVDMGLDANGEPLTSRVINWDVERQERVKPEKKSQAQLILEDALTRTFEAHRQQITVDGVNTEAVPEKLLRDAFRELYLQDKPGADKNAVRQRWYSAFDKMGSRIVQGIVEGVAYVWYPSSEF